MQKRKYLSSTVVYLSKNSEYKWTHAVQTHSRVNCAHPNFNPFKLQQTWETWSVYTWSLCMSRA